MRTPQGIVNHTLAKRRYKERNREKLRLAALEYHRVNREQRNAQNKERYRKNPERNLAQLRVKRALASGDLTRDVCVFCGDDDPHGHHEDYDKALEVIWLCRPHHQQVHTGRIKLNGDHKLDEEKL